MFLELLPFVKLRRAIDDVGMTGRISLVYAGGIRNGGDVAKAVALGADAVAIGHCFAYGT